MTSPTSVAWGSLLSARRTSRVEPAAAGLAGWSRLSPALPSTLTLTLSTATRSCWACRRTWLGAIPAAAVWTSAAPRSKGCSRRCLCGFPYCLAVSESTVPLRKWVDTCTVTTQDGKHRRGQRGDPLWAWRRMLDPDAPPGADVRSACKHERDALRATPGANVWTGPRARYSGITTLQPAGDVESIPTGHDWRVHHAARPELDRPGTPTPTPHNSTLTAPDPPPCVPSPWPSALSASAARRRPGSTRALCGGSAAHERRRADIEQLLLCPPELDRPSPRS
jgi:hypothetical protein